MKKLIMMIMLSLVLLLPGCAAKGQLKFVSIETITEKMTAGETFLMYFGRSDCTACIEFKPTLKTFIENHELTVYGIESDDTKLHTKEAVDQWIKDYAPTLKWTPTMFYIKDGKVVDMQSGVMDFNQLADFSADYEANLKNSN